VEVVDAVAPRLDAGDDRGPRRGGPGRERRVEVAGDALLDECRNRRQLARFEQRVELLEARGVDTDEENLALSHYPLNDCSRH
jgi:hypothetical protein